MGPPLQTETTSRASFPRWIAFCEMNNRTPFFMVRQAEKDQWTHDTKFGLNLYPSTLFEQSLPDYSEAYDKALVTQFIDFLQHLDVGRGTALDRLKKGRSFLNAHLKIECKLRMQAAGHSFPQLGTAQIGKLQGLKAAREAASRAKEGKSKANFEDVHAKSDDELTDEELCGEFVCFPATVLFSFSQL